jgi:hypothetical protein
MTGIHGTTRDGRPAWLLSLPKREWVVVDPALHGDLLRQRRRWWIKGLLLLTLLMAINGLVDWIFELRTVPWAALVLAQLHLLQEDWQWRRHLRNAGERVTGGVRPADLPRESFWQALSFVPAAFAVPVTLFHWDVARMKPGSFLVLMLLCWALIVAHIFQGRALRQLAQESADGMDGQPAR